MSSPRKKIAIVGAGYSGICAIAALKEEDGFEPVCFEKTDKPGGIWCYREEPLEGYGSVMPTTIINHSKEMGAFSNFPPRKEHNNFMKHEEMYEYLMEYANSRDLNKHIIYNSFVTSIKKSDDYDETGKWIISVKNTVSGIASTDVYDGVLVCIGHNNKPKMPSYPDQDAFKGKIMHTQTLKGMAPYQNQRVVVVGMGCSGLDAAVETSSVAKQVYLSTRSGAHVITRVGNHGYPYDYIFIRPWLYQLMDILPINVVSWLFETIYIDEHFHHDLYTVKPEHHLLSKDPVLNDHIGSKLLSGTVIQKPDIQRFTEDGVIFEGDDEVTKADVVIMATGYTWEFPLLEDGIVEKEEGRINLFKLAFPTQLKHSTLAIIGFVLPYGPGIPLIELQCRWAAQVFAGKCKLPPPEVMLKDVKDRHDANSVRFTPSDKMSVRVDIIQFCDDLASQFGAKPELKKLFLTDIRLFMKIIFGPSLPYQYRLQGPHSWDGARDAIMTSLDRITWPLTKGNSKPDDESLFRTTVRKLLSLIIT